MLSRAWEIAQCVKHLLCGAQGPEFDAQNPGKNQNVMDGTNL